MGQTPFQFFFILPQFQKLIHFASFIFDQCFVATFIYYIFSLIKSYHATVFCARNVSFLLTSLLHYLLSAQPILHIFQDIHSKFASFFFLFLPIGSLTSQECNTTRCLCQLHLFSFTHSCASASMRLHLFSFMLALCQHRSQQERSVRVTHICSQRPRFLQLSCVWLPYLNLNIVTISIADYI